MPRAAEERAKQDREAELRSSLPTRNVCPRRPNPVPLRALCYIHRLAFGIEISECVDQAAVGDSGRRLPVQVTQVPAGRVTGADSAMQMATQAVLPSPIENAVYRASPCDPPDPALFSKKLKFKVRPMKDLM